VKLYYRDGLFLFRLCHCLAYASESGDIAVLAQRQAAKIKARLGGSTAWSAPFPPKPKGIVAADIRAPVAPLPRGRGTR
jgi:hypothetical protein